MKKLSNKYIIKFAISAIVAMVVSRGIIELFGGDQEFSRLGFYLTRFCGFVVSFLVTLKILSKIKFFEVEREK